MIEKVIVPEEYKDRLFLPEYNFTKRLNLLYGTNGIGKTTLINILNPNKQKYHFRVSNKKTNYYEHNIQYTDTPNVAVFSSSINYPNRNKNNVAPDNLDDFALLYQCSHISEGQGLLISFENFLFNLDNSVNVLLIDELDSGLSITSIQYVAHILTDWLNEHPKVQCFISINNYHWVYLFKEIYRMDTGTYEKIEDYKQFCDLTVQITLALQEKEQIRREHDC